MTESEQKYMLLFMFLYEHEESKLLKDWNDFLDEITYSNRFSPQNNIILEIDENTVKSENRIKKGTILYRARIFDKNPYEKYLQLCKQHGGITDAEFKQFKEKLGNNLTLSFFGRLLNSAQEISTDNPMYIAYKKWENTRFKGYNKKDSLPPPKEKVSAGRVNPEHIRYLYMSEDEETPIYEVRPIIGQYVSLAKLKTLKDLRIYDLTQQCETEVSEKKNLPNLFQIIGERFSMPNSGNSTEYLPTQYISEHIKNMGFDGIRFSSSLNKDGKNLVVFNPDFCRPISSDLVKVTANKLEFEKPDMLY